MNEDGKVSVGELKGVPETLLIPLVGRAVAAKRFPDLGFRDEWAERIVERLDFNPSRFSRDVLSMRGAAERAATIDRLARSFFEKHPDGLGVSLGAGLCTRYHRVDNGRLRWVDLDLPEVMEIKRKLLPEEDRYRLVTGSLLDPSWPSLLGWTPGTPLFLVSEGVLIYFTEEQVRSVLSAALGEFTTGADLVFDYVHPLFRAFSGFNPSVALTGSRFHFGMRGPSKLLDESPRLELVADVPFLTTSVAGAVDGAVRKLRGVSLYALAHYRLRPA